MRAWQPEVLAAVSALPQLPAAGQESEVALGLELEPASALQQELARALRASSERVPARREEERR